MLDLIIKNGSCFIDGNLQKLSIGISKGNIEKIRPINRKKGLPGGWGTPSVCDTAMNSPQSQ